jgi:hypothetical protein
MIGPEPRLNYAQAGEIGHAEKELCNAGSPHPLG